MLGVVAMTSCAERAQPFTEAKYVIRNNQTVRLSQYNLSITNKGCGRKWMSDGVEKPYCDIEIRNNDSTFYLHDRAKPLYVGNLIITLEKINPWGREEDSLPAGACQVWVRRTEGR